MSSVSTPKRVSRFLFAWLFCRPFVLATAFGYWLGSDDLTYWQCVKIMWKDPLA